MDKSRDYYFDNAKFFLILLVVLGHAMEVVSGDYVFVFYKLIYLFHMPAFILVSGYFMKFQKKQKFSELITQYLVFQIIYFCFDTFILEGYEKFSFITPYWILWFFLALIIWKAITPYVVRLKYPIIITIILAVLAGYDNSIGYYLSLSRIIVLYPFFLLGYYAEKRHFEKLKTLVYPVAWMVLFAFSFLMLFIGPSFYHRLLFHSESYQFMGLYSWSAGALRLLLLAWGFALLVGFFAMIPNSKRIYSHLGQRTLQVFILHGFIIKLLTHYKVEAFITTPLHKTLFFIGIILMTLVLMTKPFQYIFYPLTYLSKLLFAGKDSSVS